MSSWPPDSVSEVRSLSWPGCPAKGHELIPFLGYMVSCSSRLSVRLPNRFFPLLSPHWVHTGGATKIPCACWCSPAQANRECSCWLSLGPEWGKSYQVCFNTLEYPLFCCCCRPPWFQFVFPQQTALWNSSQQREDADKCQLGDRAASLQLEIFCVFYVVHRECTLQNWKYFLGKRLWWQFTRNKCFMWRSVLSMSPFSWSKASPVCVQHAALSLLPLSPSCQHISQGEMSQNHRKV